MKTFLCTHKKVNFTPKGEPDLLSVQPEIPNVEGDWELVQVVTVRNPDKSTGAGTFLLFYWRGPH